MGCSESRRKLWKKRKENDLCIYCGNNKPLKNKRGCVKCLKKKVEVTVRFCKNNPSKQSEYNKKVRKKVFEKYGSICECCGESHIELLSIDHINNDGYKERIDLYGTKSGSGTSWYLKLAREPIREDLQTLCYNCNIAKYRFGICPHKKDYDINYLLNS